MRFICNVERKYESDVIVIGGGTSGVFAAIAAARCVLPTPCLPYSSMPSPFLMAASLSEYALHISNASCALDAIKVSNVLSPNLSPRLERSRAA